MATSNNNNHDVFAEAVTTVLNLLENVSLDDQSRKVIIETLSQARRKKKRPKLEEEAKNIEETEEAGDGPTKMTPVDSKLPGTSYEMVSIFPFLDIVHGQEVGLKKDRKYTGTVFNNRPHGSGFMVYDDGRVVCGNWYNGVLHGQACVIYQNGHNYFGDFKNHQRDGKGLYIYTDKSKYFGDYSKDDRHGKGEYRTAEKIYKGNFKEGEFEEGTVRGANGKVIEAGRFEDWELVEPASK